ncbi:MAG: SWIM zinc finger family protein [Proteobacteria bacterium]|nr:SWIM zinc finger family protein [Pseudomonadota bacterium]
MSNLDIRVQIAGSSGNVYEIKLFQWGGKTKLRCDCQASKSGYFCKHRRAILHKDQSGYDSRLGVLGSWDEMQEALDATGLRKRVLAHEARRVELESDMDSIKDEIKAAKARVAAACEGGD